MISDLAVTDHAAALAGAALAKALGDCAATIEDTLADLLPEVAGPEARLWDAMRYSTLGGGKRMRAFLVMQGASLFGVEPRCAARVAAAVEMLHAYSLIHDDLPSMDNDDLRRGKPSNHRAFDEATAILAGDALQSRAFEILAEPDTHSQPEARAELVLALAHAVGAAGMCGGQMIDMLAEGQSLTAEQIGRLHTLKTGRLIQFSAEAGAILGRAGPHQRAALAAYGRDLGAAFQIADDVLDVTGTEAEIGKTAGKDTAAGKATLVAILGVDRARLQAERLAAQAVTHLDSFDAQADHLRYLANHITTRRS